MKKIAILCSGGDAPGMNACIRAAVRTALARGMEIVGVRRGYSGLISGNVLAMDRATVSNIIHQGGTILQTSRCPDFETKRGRAMAVKVLENAKIDGLVLVGGDGTFRGGHLLAQECGVGIVGVPGTIDNDVYGTDYTIGFDTAVNCAIEAIDRIRDTALSHERLFFVEVMGHHTGFIALETAVAAGAEEVLIPEMPATVHELCQRLEESFKRGKSSAIVVVAEREQPGCSFRIADEVKTLVGRESRVCVLGHIQRGGSPSARDRVLATSLGVAAVAALADGRTGCMVGEVKGEITHTPLKDTWGKTKEPAPFLTQLARTLSD